MRRQPLIGLSGCIVLLLFVSPAEAAPRRIALLAGVNKYDKRGFADAPLQYAERDIEEMAKELRAADYEVRVLLGTSTGAERASLLNIRAALRTLLQDVNANDIVLVGLAGHGQQIEVKSKAEAFFCPVDAVKGDPGTMLGMAELIATLEKKGGINLVLVDACRDDADPNRGRGVDGDAADRLPANTAVFFSCAARQRSFETEKAGGGHGVFFHFVLEGLRGKAATRGKQVTWGSLVDYVSTEMSDEALRAWLPGLARNVSQTPHAVSNMKGRPIVLVSRGEARPEPPPPPKDEIDVQRDPGTLANYRGQNGKTFVFRVTGVETGGLWGSGPYTDDSSLAMAAVHAGVLKAGETGVVQVIVTEGRSEYVGSSRNGIVSKDYESWGGSFRIVGAKGGDEPARAKPRVQSLAGRTGNGVWVTTTGKTYFTYEFRTGGTVIYRSRTETLVGSWAQNGKNVGVHVGTSKEYGTIEGNTLTLQCDTDKVGRGVATITFSD